LKTKKYLLTFLIIISFSVIQSNAITKSKSYLLFGHFSNYLPYLIAVLLIIIIIIFLFQTKHKKSKSQISSLADKVQITEKNYKLLFENMIAAIAVYQDNKIITVNEEMETLTGYSKQELANSPINKYVHSDDLKRVLSIQNKFFKTEATKINYEYRLIAKNNNIVYVNCDIIKTIWNNEPAILSLLTNITEQKKAKEQIFASEEKFKIITENVSDIIWIVNLKLNKIVYINPAMTILTGYTFDEIKNIKIDNILLANYYQEFMNIVAKNYKIINEDDNTNTYDRYEMQIKHRDGSIVWTETVMKFFKNENKEPLMLCSTRNIDDRKKDEEKINYLLNHDSLTGFYNRRSFESLLKKYDNKKYYPLTIIFSDMNGLKLANDIFGHTAGDELIQKSAKALKSAARENDVFARIGGDEFIILLPNTNFQEASMFMLQVKKALEKETVYTIQCSLAMGFDIKTNNQQNIEAIKENAENEMYKEKTESKKIFDQKILENIINTFYEIYPDEKFHSEHTSKMCEHIGKQLNLSGNEIYTLQEAGRLHNIGKLPNSLKGIKPDNLDTSKIYPAISYRILSLFDETIDIADFVYQHKENWDGSGYPKGLKGNQIHIISQILSISDHYVSLITGIYGNYTSVNEAVKIINSLSGKKFNPLVVKAFNEYIEKNK